MASFHFFYLEVSLLSVSYTFLSDLFDFVQASNCVIDHIYTEKNRMLNCLASGNYNFNLGFFVVDDILN